MTLNTVNVVETNSEGVIVKLQSFPETQEGNTMAEKVFSEMIEDTNHLDVFIEDGYAEISGGRTVYLVHSS